MQQSPSHEQIVYDMLSSEDASEMAEPNQKTPEEMHDVSEPDRDLASDEADDTQAGAKKTPAKKSTRKKRQPSKKDVEQAAEQPQSKQHEQVAETDTSASADEETEKTEEEEAEEQSEQDNEREVGAATPAPVSDTSVTISSNVTSPAPTVDTDTPSTADETTSAVDADTTPASTDTDEDAGTPVFPPRPELVIYRVPEIAPTTADQHKFYGVTLLTKDDLYYFNEGTNYRLYNKLGSTPLTVDGVAGTYFAVWAPDAVSVSVMGDFNGWNRDSHPLYLKGSSGVWENFIPGVGKGDLYKYFIVSRYNDYRVEKADPYAFHSETPPNTASIVWDLEYTWNDDEWLAKRKNINNLDEPITVYEVHLGSWMRVPEEDHRFMTYREIAPKLTEYVKNLGFTHVEFMPLMEHPFYGSWGYQVTGFFAPTSRYGTPQDLMYLIDTLHQEGIGVILDWVPSHFPVDQHGLGVFDGTHVYEHSYPQKGWHPDWSSFIFNYGRHEVRSFLMSSAFYWLDTYHIDGLRVDAVASMLYLDYSRNEGEWMPNEYGGKENIEAIDFLRRFNVDIYNNYPGVQTFAEESTDWSMVSRPTYVGGLGFGLKWDMGWMHDTLTYIAHDPIYRKYHHNEMTFRMIYAFTENFILPLSHDEVVHGKGSLLSKMPGDLWQKFANLRLLLGYMYAQPGKKLLFMGGEIGQWREWYHEESLDWHLLQFAPHAGLQRWVKDLNTLYCNEPSLYELDCDPSGFRWIDCHDWEQSMFSMIRRGASKDSAIVAVCNFTPVPRFTYRIGVPFDAYWTEVLNSDAVDYEGSGQGNLGGVQSEPFPSHGYAQSINVNVPPLGIVFFKGECTDCEDW